MVTVPVALVRTVALAVVLEAVGAVVVTGMFAAADAPASVRLTDGTTRAQIVWIGGHSLAAMLACGVGAWAGASALLRAGHRPRLAWTVPTLTLVGCLVAAAALAVSADLLALLLGATVLLCAVIGAGLGATTAVLRAEADDLTLSGRYVSPPSAAATRGWGSRRT